MTISTKGRYGLEAVVDLAIHASRGHECIKNISERCGISEAYILQIFMVLRRAGIIDSIRGAQGGYALAREASEITSGEVLVALEGPLAPVECIVEGTKHPCGRSGNCVTRSLWTSIMRIMNDTANEVTIQDLVDCYHSLSANKEEGLEYFL